MQGEFFLDDMKIRPAKLEDVVEIVLLLEDCELPVAGVQENINTFLVAFDGEKLVGCCGAEAHQFAALIRSLAVDVEYRGIGLGRRLTREMIDRLASRGLREFYLLTTTAEDFFKRRGFRTIDRDEIHPQLTGSPEFEICPETAVAMRLVMT